MKKLKFIFIILGIIGSIACIVFAIIGGNKLAAMGWFVAVLNGINFVLYELSGGGK